METITMEVEAAKMIGAGWPLSLLRVLVLVLVTSSLLW